MNKIKIYIHIKVPYVKESNRGKLNSHIKTALQNEKIKQLWYREKLRHHLRRSVADQTWSVIEQ